MTKTKRGTETEKQKTDDVPSYFALNFESSSNREFKVDVKKNNLEETFVSFIVGRGTNWRWPTKEDCKQTFAFE